MKIYSAQFKGTTTVSTGSNVSLTGSFSGSIAGIDINATNQFTASTSTRLTNIEIISASNINRITSLETNSASVDILNTTQNTRLTNIENKTGSLATTGSNSFFGTQVFSGSVFIANDLVVQGSSSIQYISASSVSIGTNIVQLNTATPSVRFAGLTVQDSGSSAGVTGSMLWDSLCNRWIYSNPSTIGYSGGMLLSGPRASTLGTETTLTCNYVAKSGGGDHLYDSCIWEMSGSVGVNTNSPFGSSTEKTIHLTDAGCGYATVYVTNATNSVKSILAIASATNLGYVGMQSNSNFQIRTNDIERVTFACNGTISVGTITPKYDWYTQAYSGIQINGATTVWGRASDSHFASNYYVKCCSTNGVASDTYIANGYANDLWFDNNAGQFRYRVGACGVADNSISWTTPFQICNNGYTSINTTSDGYAMLCLVSTGGDAGMYLRGGATNGGGWTIQAQNGCNLVFVDRTAGANPVRMTIASGGNIGINTTNFGERLNIGCGGAIAWQNSCMCQKWHIQYNSADGLNFVESAVADFRLFLKAGGNVGVGLSAPTAQLHICSAYSQTPLLVQGGGNGNIPIACFYSGVNQIALLDDNGNLIIGSTSFSTRGTVTSSGLMVSGRVGIGTSTPGFKLEVQKTGAGASGIFINQCSADEATIRFKSTHDANSDYRVGASILYGSAFEIYHVNCSTTRFWISACGATMIGTGTDTAISSNDPVHKIGNNGPGTSYARLMMQERTGCWISLNNGSGVNYGVIQRDGGAGVTYGSNSDYRLKTNIQNMNSACGLARVMCLRPVLFDWITECKSGEGFIAHELQEIIPNAVSGQKDAINEHCHPSYQNVDTRNIVPTLVKAIQEQQCKIALLESCLGIN